MAITYTPDQQKVIDNRGALLVSAAAGSGKTAVLVERIMGCILDPVSPIDLHQLLVLTFTNAAAAEMKERIALRLQKELEKDPENHRLRRQQMYLAKANITTVDSFCKTLVCEYFERLDCSPDCKVLSGTALAALEGQAMEQTLNTRLTLYPEQMKRLVETLSPKGTFGLQQIITDIDSYLRSLPFPSLWLEMARKGYENFTAIEDSPFGQALIASAAGKVQGAVEILSRGLPLLEGEEAVAGRYASLKEALGSLHTLQAALLTPKWDTLFELAHSPERVKFTACKKADEQTLALTVRLQKAYHQALEEVQAAFSLSGEAIKEQYEILTPAVCFLLDTVEEYRATANGMKKEQNAMDFADMEYAALSLLVELKNSVPTPTPLAGEIGSRFAFVMVDEFQDSNDLQTAIYNALSGGGKTLFTVGDVKQSIYRFRKANPNNFLHLLNTYPLYDGKCSPGTVLLKGNFRSRGEICRTVNSFFSLVMTVGAGEIDYDASHALEPLGQFPPFSAPVVYDLLEQEEERTAIQIEADRIACHIKKAMETPCVTDGDTLRPARYEDCVILLRTLRGKVDQYVNRLREHGIPAVSDSTGGFFDKREILLITALLSAVNNPTDDLAMASVMLSPFFGFTAEELSALRATARHTPLFITLKKAADGGEEKAKTLVSALEELRLFSATLSPSALLQKIYQTYHVPALVQLWDGGDLRRQNLLALLSLAEEWEQNGGVHLLGFLTYLHKLSQEDEDSSFLPQCTGQGKTGVRIMSIHRSKGLQFPLCFLAGCSAPKGNKEAKGVMADETLGLGVTLHNPRLGTRTTTPLREAILQKANRAAVSEELRIFYVAMTRAIDRLYLITLHKNPPKAVADALGDLEGKVTGQFTLDPSLVLSASNFGKLFLYFALLHPSGGVLRVMGTPEAGFLPANTEDFQVNLVKSAEIIPPAPLVAQQENPLRMTDSALLEEIRQNMTYQNPYAPLEGLFAKRSVSALTHDTGGVPPIPRPGFLQQQGLSPAEKGTALHAFMQYANYQNAATDPQKELARLVEKAFLTPTQGEAVPLEKLRGFFQSPLYARMAASPKVLREHRFMAALPAPLVAPSLGEEWQEQNVVVQGITDCLFWEEDGFVLVDYKTDKVKTPEELLLRYQKQLQLYAKMLGEAEGKGVKQLLLYSFALGQTVEVPLD